MQRPKKKCLFSKFLHFMTTHLPDAATIVALQRKLVSDWHQSDTPAVNKTDGFLLLVEENSLRNYTLWHHEDDARRDDMGFEFVYKAKRAIDAANQQRNDFIEKMDKALYAAVGENFGEATQMNTETPGMSIDRLSILSLKEYHMREEFERGDASEAHKSKCEQKLKVIRQQIEDLSYGLQALLEGCASGERGFRVYFQFKMYNDPELNPALYKKS